ncbi:23S rRNA (adenine(2503)-C(2))-methyltransferase RlmN [Candidatus Woesearchaeota archaeon CG10_big_fil_rev_8_21_14_0_10_37_12]|nr:MAG: 23S rRNA (adenine(2503)-C(2))-methyltransferase RlmN [Candidatus Woesearchaeota archaeon CG10_big_fil_rev_8_21_14_0_10_37_12]
MQISSETKSSDGTRKFLIELDDKKKIEAVLIFHKRTVCICISSQVGCAMKCSFCATGLMGFSRNLTKEEIVGQFNLLQSVCDRPITNIVFMGMGEPLHNYDNVVDAVNEFRKREISWKKITVSTVGLPDKIKQLAKDTQCCLALSLHAPNDELRSKLVPINQRFPIRELLDACKEFPVKNNLPVMIEYVLIKGVNDSQKCAEELATVLQILPNVMVNIIPYNSVAGIGYERPSLATAEEFKQILINAGYKTIIRTTKGVDTQAACGMLAVK